MMRINPDLFPVKMHYFFFMAAMGPILPFYPLVGKQLGLSEAALGSITAVFPLLYLFLKPFIGLIVDYFYRWRKFFFLGFILLTCLSFNLLIPIQDSVTLLPWANLTSQCNSSIIAAVESCRMNCLGDLSYEVHKLSGGSICIINDIPLATSNLSCDSLKDSKFNSSLCCLQSALNDSIIIGSFTANPACSETVCVLQCSSLKFNFSYTFWIFTIFTSLGSIFFSITNFFSDAICFDVLGEGNSKKYGYQRVWGAVGFGLSALIGGYAVDLASKNLPYYDFLPAFVLATVCIAFDLYFSSKLKFPHIPKSDNIMNDVWSLLRTPRVTFFLIFATFVGIMDSSIFYYLLWYMEDLAIESGHKADIKLIQGLTVALETLGGETISFFLSKWILEKIGYAHSLSLGFVFYSVRLGLLASISQPWVALPIEALLQGPSYALLYSTIVAYASSITPPGTSGTVQGLVAGMDDGLGISLGSFIGGFIYSYYGGRVLYISYSCLSLVCAIVHCAVYIFFFRKNSEDMIRRSAAYNLVKTDVEMTTFEKPKSIT